MAPILWAAGAGLGGLILWALSGKKPAGAPGSDEVTALADTVSTSMPHGERAFLPEAARNLLVSLASATASISDPTNPFMVEYAPIPSGQAVTPDKSAFGWVSSENKARSILAPIYAVTTAASKQRKFLRSVAPGTESDLAGPNGIYAVLVYAGALQAKQTPPGIPPGQSNSAPVPAPNAPPTPPAAPAPGAPPAPGPSLSLPNPLPNIPFPSPVIPAGPVPSGASIQSVIAPSGANIRSSANGAKIGALNTGSTVAVLADAGSAAGHQWKQIRILTATPGSNGAVAVGTTAFVAADLLSGGGGILPGPSLPNGGLPGNPGGVIPAVFNPGAPAGNTQTVIAPSGANIRSSANGAKIGALAKGSTVSVLADAGSAAGHQWKQISVVTATPGSNGSVAPGTTAFVAADLLSGGGGMLAGYYARTRRPYWRFAGR
jgi:hypothetical protein